MRLHAVRSELVRATAAHGDPGDLETRREPQKLLLMARALSVGSSRLEPGRAGTPSLSAEKIPLFMAAEGGNGYKLHIASITIVGKMLTYLILRNKSGDR